MIADLRGLARDAALDALAVLLPVECAGCGADDRALCRECRCALAPRIRWHRLDDGLPVAAALDYAGVAREVILAVKERGRTDAAGPLAAALDAALEAVLEALAGAEIVAVPTSRAARRRRGYDPVELLLRRAGRTRSRVFAARQERPVQKGLNREERMAAVRGSIHARRPLSGRRFVIVDDVLTTGATLMETARAIRSAGGEAVAAAVVAATPRNFPEDFRNA